MTTPFGLYLASWEHLYLMPGGTPAGLPNHIFARDPWTLVLFEKLYCDENGLKGEDNASRLLGWTNSGLFVRLVRERVLEPLPIEAHVRSRAREMRGSFTNFHGLTPEEAAAARHVSVGEFFAWRTELLRDFLDQRQLLLYDFDLIGASGPFPVLLEETAKGTLPLEVRSAPITASPRQLRQALRDLFEDLQRFEAEPLQRLRTGVLDQLTYLGILQRRASDYATIDVELSEGVDERLNRILEIRQRFGDRGGWETVQRLLSEHRRGEPPESLGDLRRELEDKLDNCYLPRFGEFRRGVAEIGKALVSLIDVIHIGRVAQETLEGLKKLRSPINDLVHYVRRRLEK